MATGILPPSADIMKTDYDIKSKESASKTADDRFMKVFEVASKSYNYDSDKTEYREADNYSNKRSEYEYDYSQQYAYRHEDNYRDSHKEHFNSFEGKEHTYSKEKNDTDHYKKETGEANSPTAKPDKHEQAGISETKAEAKNPKAEIAHDAQNTTKAEAGKSEKEQKTANAVKDKPVAVAAQTIIIKDAIKPLDDKKTETAGSNSAIAKAAQAKAEPIKPEQAKTTQTAQAQTNSKPDAAKAESASSEQKPELKTEAKIKDTSENGKDKAQQPAQKALTQAAQDNKQEISDADKKLNVKNPANNQELAANTADKAQKATTELASDIPEPKKIDIKEELKVESIKVSANAQKGKDDAQSSLMNMNKNDQQGMQQESKANTASIQAGSTDSTAQKVDLQGTNRFEKAMDANLAKQAESTEKAVLNQVKNAASQLNNEKSQVTIALRPENLGRVNIQLTSQNGQLAAQITADSQQAKDALTKGIEALRQTLAEQGINVNRIVVNTQESSSENGNNLANTDKEETAFSQAGSKSHEQNNSAGKSTEGQGIDLADGTSELPEEEATEQEQEIRLTGSTVDYKV